MARGGIFSGAEEFGEFAARMKVRAGHVEKNATLTFRRLFIAVGGQVIQATPVDTGHARNNWLAGKNAAQEGTPNPEGEGGASAVLRVTNTGLALEITDTGHITNNVPYIKRLNDGHSGQAPAGFVQKAMAVGAQSIQGFKLLD